MNHCALRLPVQDDGRMRVQRKGGLDRERGGRNSDWNLVTHVTSCGETSLPDLSAYACVCVCAL